MSASCLLACYRRKVALDLGKWACPPRGTDTDAYFDCLLLHVAGKRASREQALRIIEVFIAQSDGATLRLIGENEMDLLVERDPAWRIVCDCQEIISVAAYPPAESL